MAQAREDYLRKKREYYQNNKDKWKIVPYTDKVRKRKKEWAEKNKEKIAKKKKEYQEKNKDILYAKKKIYIANNKEYKSQYDKQYRAKNKDRQVLNLLRREYGITLEDFNKMFTDQEGRCAICGTHQTEIKKRLAVDHCHASKNIRGLLCSSCNTGLGNFKDNINFLMKAIKYLQPDS